MNANSIIIQNAHANNLKHISLEIPKRKVVAFTGVSGSGKSSLLFDTIYTEAQRQLIETFSTFARKRLPKLSRPDVDDILNLSTAMVIDQKKMGANLRSTVGTATEVNTYLRLLFSRLGTPFLGASFLFSFNHPQGMCGHCHGLGKTARVDLDLFLDRGKSIRDGGILHIHYKPGSFLWNELIKFRIVDPDKKIQDYSPEELDLLLYSEPFLIKGSKEAVSYHRNFEGLVRKLERSMAEKGEDEADEEDKNAYLRFFRYESCPRCQGSRISDAARGVKLNGVSIDEVCRWEMPEVLSFLKSIDDERALPITRKAIFIVEQLIHIGVGYLSLERPVGTLSGGESQRVKMARQLDCNLVDLLYVLDEPTTGLHPRDTERLIGLLFELKNRGNSVFVVEHDPEVIKACEWIVDMGPEAGSKGGAIVYNGPTAGIAQADSVTGRVLYQDIQANDAPKEPAGYFQIENATANNLRNVSVRIPKGLLSCVTGVSGSGKSSLIHECFLPAHPEAVVIDQSPIGRSSRANPLTYTGIFDAIRKEFASHTGANASLFSFNSAGACPKCNGQGFISYELNFIDAVQSACDECEGRRYHADVLEYRYMGKNIADVLDLSVQEALRFFKAPKINKHLSLLQDVGLGYLKLGQTLSSLSGGESQRLKIATELQKESNIFIMDEPTTGLHRSDIDTFYRIIRKLVDRNNTVIIIEHNTDIIKRADWVIDLGPEGGKNGGLVLAEGTPAQVKANPKSVTGKYL
ncbi:MAG TPA: daunorubicin resistance protein DrrC [Spirochaetaceae bacterium]|nr:daunorubicin resistance protein DrrC [Spirochaetaceae bacterium]